MKPALTIAATGLINAANKLTKAADSTNRRFVEESRASASAERSSTAQASTNTAASLRPAELTRSEPGDFALSIGSYVPSMAEDTVNMKLAAASYKTNAALLRTVSDMQQALAESFNPRD